MREFDRAIEALRRWGDSEGDWLPPRTRLLLLKLDQWVELERRYLDGDQTAVEQAQPLLALADTRPYSEVKRVLCASAVMDAARAVRFEAGRQLREARERTRQRCRDAYMFATEHCTACRAPLHASRPGLCPECAQRWDPYGIEEVEAASAVVDRCWREKDVAGLCAYLDITYRIIGVKDPGFQRAVHTAMEQGDEQTYRLLRRLARWYAGEAGYVTVRDPDALHAVRQCPEALRWIQPLAHIISRREQRRQHLLSRRAHLRRLRNAKREWVTARAAAEAMTYRSPHPDIRGIGLEIECGVDTMRLAVAREEITRERRVTHDAIELARDVSVFVRDTAGIGGDWMRNAEIKVRIDRAAEWPQWAQRIIALWRAASVQQNHTCGNHVHVMFSNRALRAIARPHFLRWFYQQYWVRWGRADKYTARLDCSYCRWDTPSASAIRHRMDRRGSRAEGSTRYRAVNWHAVCEHGTVEFRLLPHAESGEEYARAVEWLLNTLGDYLRRELDHPQQLSLPF
jgi:hypothetical protein